MKVNEEGSLLVFCTEDRKYYLYNIHEDFLFDKISRMKITVCNLFFSPKSSNIFGCMANGNIFQ